jgi:hypothetical protein
VKNKTYFVFPTTSNPKFPTIFWPKTKTTPGLSSRFLQLQGESRDLCHRCCDFQSGSQGRERFGAKGIHIPYGHGQNMDKLLVFGGRSSIHESVNRDSNSDLQWSFFTVCDLTMSTFCHVLTVAHVGFIWKLVDNEIQSSVSLSLYMSIANLLLQRIFHTHIPCHCHGEPRSDDERNGSN